MKVLGRILVPPFDAFWEQFGGEVPIPVEYIEEGHSSVFGNQGMDLSAPNMPEWTSLPDDDLSYHVAHELTHIVMKERGFPRSARGPQYPEDSAEARVGGDLGACPRKTLFVIMLTTSEHKHIGKQCNANRTIVQCALCTSLVSENTQTHS